MGHLAYALLLTGDADEAEIVARKGVERSHGMVPQEVTTLAILSLILLAKGRALESLATAEEALSLPVGPTLSWDELSLTRGEALAALGRTDEAHAAIREARDRVLRTASTLEEDDRVSYLTSASACVRTLKLAREWLGEG
jgi:tetratricopeptide (TPR) repeat protein